MGSRKKGDSKPRLRAELIPPTVPEVRRLVCAMVGPEEQRSFKLGWSIFRRAHQAIARRCHRAAHTAKQSVPPRLVASDEPAGPGPAEPPDGPSGRGNLRLTDEEWTKVEPLLPPQKPPVGRPARDHRAMVDAVLWVLSTGASWREIPRETAPWRTVYGRHRRWREEGRWQRVSEALGDDGISTSEAKVSL